MSEFTGNNNKMILWDLLNNNRAFINKTQNDSVQMFESMIQNINNNYTNETLINKNKLLISNIMKSINNIPQRNTKKEDATEIIQVYESKQNEMNDFLKPVAPKEVSFTEDKDEPIKDLDREIELQMEKRNLDIAITDQSNNTMVADWINGKTTSMPPVQKQAPKITFLNDDKETKNKHVHWATDIENTDENKLLDENITLSDIMKKLNEIDNKLNILLK